LIATNNGLIQLNVKEFSKKKKVQNIQIGINAIKVNGEAYKRDLYSMGVYENNQIKLDYNQNDIEIVFHPLIPLMRIRMYFIK
jgi:hypothetical protein